MSMLPADVHRRLEPAGVDEAALARLHANGAKAWADVPDAAQWVNHLRGGSSAITGVRCAACDRPAVEAIVGGLRTFPAACSCGSQTFNAELVPGF